MNCLLKLKLELRLVCWLIYKIFHRLYHQSYFVIFLKLFFLEFFIADFSLSGCEFDNLSLHFDIESIYANIISKQKRFFEMLQFLVKKSK